MNSRRSGFTLVELVVVLSVLGILAAVAAPKVLYTSDDARLTSSLQSVTIVRDAISLYEVENSVIPAGATLESDLATYIRGHIPIVNVGPNRGSRAVKLDSTTSGLKVENISGAEGWTYNTVTGEFAVNSTATSGVSGDTTPLWER